VKLDRAGFPFIGGTAAFAVAAALTVGSIGAVPLLFLTAFFLFFFRDPDRQPPSDADSAALSPADGRVLVAGPANAEPAPPGAWQQVSIFLSPMDVHVNRSPVSGRVVKVELRRGRYLPAYHDQAATVNERSEVWLDHRGKTVVFRQIVGILARRVVCRVRSGDVVNAGQRVGIMKFGSRMDVFLPPEAVLKVAVGDRVVGGMSVIATLDSGL
jgi:phosphatidylserine decarboxylase